MKSDKEIVYGPVASWRLGRSLGVDIICGEKQCTFDCTYCQLGDAGETTTERRLFVETEKVVEAVKEALNSGVEADVITLSGSGEPTLATNLGEIIEELKNLSSLPVAVLTSGSLMSRQEVREALKKADIVKAKLDAPDKGIFKRLNRPQKELELEVIISAMRKFAAESDVFFALEIMFTPENMDKARRLAELAETIGPDEIQINTPHRGSSVSPLTATELDLVSIPFEQKKLVYRAVNREQRPEVKDLLGRSKLKKLKRGEE